MYVNGMCNCIDPLQTRCIGRMFRAKRNGRKEEA